MGWAIPHQDDRRFVISILHATALRTLWYTRGRSPRLRHSLPQRAHRRVASGRRHGVITHDSLLKGAERHSRTRQQGSATTSQCITIRCTCSWQVIIWATTHGATYYEHGGEDLYRSHSSLVNLNNAIRLQARILASNLSRICTADTPLRHNGPTIGSGPTQRTGVHRRVYQVRGAGFGETCYSWEPYKALMHVDKLQDYLRANTMKTLILTEHK